MKGFSLIELLLVVALVSILAGSASPFLSNFLLRNQVEVTYNQVLGTIKKAQSNAMDNKNGATWGACLTENKIRFFQGNCTTPSIAEDFSVPSSITITGFSSVTFSPHRGEPSTPLTININSQLKNKIINLNAAGGINVN